MPIYYVTVRPRSLMEQDYRIEAPNAQLAEEAGYERYCEEFLDNAELEVEAKKSIDQDSAPNLRVTHKE